MSNSADPLDSPKTRNSDFIYQTVTRRDRPPADIFEECDALIGSPLEQLATELSWKMPAFEQGDIERAENTASLGLLLDALGLVRHRNPTTYDVVISTLVRRDPRHAPLRENLSTMVRPDQEAPTELVAATQEPINDTLLLELLRDNQAEKVRQSR